MGECISCIVSVTREEHNTQIVAQQKDDEQNVYQITDDKNDTKESQNKEKSEQENKENLEYLKESHYNNMEEIKITMFDKKNNDSPGFKAFQNNKTRITPNNENLFNPENALKILGKIDKFSNSFFNAYNNLRTDSQKYIALSSEFDVKDILDEQQNTAFTSEVPLNEKYYTILKTKILELFPKCKTKAQFITELKNSEPFKKQNIDVYLGEYDYNEFDEGTEEWENYCIKGVFSILQKNKEENLLLKESLSGNICCFLNLQIQKVNIIMILFN